MLFSATATKKVEEITKLALKKEPMYVGIDDSKEIATVEGLEQGTINNIIYSFYFYIFLLLYSKYIPLNSFSFCIKKLTRMKIQPM